MHTKYGLVTSPRAQPSTPMYERLCRLTEIADRLLRRETRHLTFPFRFSSHLAVLRECDRVDAAISWQHGVVKRWTGGESPPLAPRWARGVKFSRQAAERSAAAGGGEAGSNAEVNWQRLVEIEKRTRRAWRTPREHTRRRCMYAITHNVNPSDAFCCVGSDVMTRPSHRRLTLETRDFLANDPIAIQRCYARVSRD